MAAADEKMAKNTEENKAENLADKEARQEALTPYRSFIVQAPAGSGKTGLLIQRFLRLLAQDNVNYPENVLAITFTNKAAGEMRERIVKALLEAEADPHKRDSEGFDAITHNYALDVLKKSDSRDWNLLENPARLNIRTIDSLCGKLTRMMPLVSRFGGVLEPSDDQKNMYVRAASEMMHTLLYEMSDEDERERRLREDLKVVLYDFYDNMQSNMEKAIADSLEKRAEWTDLLDKRDDEIISDAETAYKVWREAIVEQLKHNGVFDVEDARTVVAACKEMWEFSDHAPFCSNSKFDIKAVLEYMNNVEITNDAILDNWVFWHNLALLLLKADKKDLRASFDGNSFKDNNFIPNGKATKEFKKLLQEDTKSHDKDKKANFKKNLVLAWDCFGDGQFSEESKAMLKRIVNLERFALECLEKVFSDEMSCDFEEIGSSAIKASDPYNQDIEATCGVDKYLMEDNRIVHILVDEYQDTSRSQFKLLNNIMRAWQPDLCDKCRLNNICRHRDSELHLECEEEGHTVFCVGDPMQSIYRFRGADVSVYTHTQNLGFDSFEDPDALEKQSIKPSGLQLKCNFRSRHNLVKKLGEDVFSAIFPAKPDPGNVDIGVIDFASSQPAANWDGAGDADENIIEVNPIIAKGKRGNDFDKVFSDWEYKDDYSEAAYEAALIAKEICKLRKEDINKERTIAVLLESKNLGTEILRRLQSLNIPVAQKEVCSLSQSEPVPLLVAMTNVFLNVLERRFWFVILRSKLVGLNMKEVAVLMERVLDDEAEKDGRYNPPKDFWHSLSRVCSKKVKVQELLKKAGMSENGLEACRRLYLAYEQAFKTRRSMGLADSVRGLWMRLGGPAICSRDEAANAEQYFEFLKRFDKRGEWPNVKTLEEGLSQLYAESSIEEGNPVQFLTIHGAKGLEFDYVFLPGLASKKNPRSEERLLNASFFSVKNERADAKEYTLLSPWMDKDAVCVSPDIYIHEAVGSMNSNGQDHEKVRLFYVAATRAKRRVYLYIYVNLKKEEKTKKKETVTTRTISLKRNMKMMTDKLFRALAAADLIPCVTSNENNNSCEWSEDFIVKFCELYQNSLEPNENSSDAQNAAGTGKNAVLRLSLDWPNEVSEDKLAEVKLWNGLWAQKAAEPEKQTDVKSKNGNESKKALGTLVHEMLEKLADLAAEDREYVDAGGELNREKFNDEILTKLIEETEIKGSFAEDKLKEIRKEALVCLRKVLSSEKGRWILKPRDGAGAEEEFQCDAQRLESIEGTGLELFGLYAKRIIDRCFFEDGVFWIVDYKTGRPKAGDVPQDFFEHKKEAYQKQLHGYVEIAKQLLSKGAEIRAALYFPFLADQGGEWSEGWLEFDLNTDFK